jgi:NAD(P)-dependent dehydrogenase (short-subunit alcohol dehydrogenase family)
MNIAIVTGGSSGIGQSAAIETACKGMGVILTYGRHPERAEETVRFFEQSGGTVAALPLELGRVEDFAAFRDAVSATLSTKWGVSTVQALVNNAGFGQMAMFDDTSVELFDEFTRVLYRGPYFLTQTLLPVLDDGASIVNVSSNSALDHGVEPGYSAYASVKGAMNTLTRYLAKELSVRGIRVNAVAPGPTHTRIGDDAFDRYPEVIAPLVANTALGRLGAPDDIGKVIAFLLSGESAWVTGQVIEVSGGHHL